MPDLTMLYKMLCGVKSYFTCQNKPFNGGGATNSTRYCYSVWLRHLVMAYKNGLLTQPDVILELGPGNSLGIGLCALLSGVNKYYALDAIDYLDKDMNLRVFDELVKLYRSNSNIPNEDEFSRVLPSLDVYDFPRNILTKELLSGMLSDERINCIRSQLLNLDKAPSANSQIIYYAPWRNSDYLNIEPVDLIYSQAVMQEIDGLDSTYKILYNILKPKGVMSHAIDFSCYGTAKEWNGHWVYSDAMWKIIKGKGRVSINRQPHSTHIALMKKHGFSIVCDIKVKRDSNITRQQLARKFKNMSDEDLVINSAFIQAVKG